MRSWPLKDIVVNYLEPVKCLFCSSLAQFSVAGEKASIYLCRQHAWHVFQTLESAVNEAPTPVHP